MAASRKIEVQLVGDAGDLERSLAGALASLKAFGSGAESTNTRFAKSTKEGEKSLLSFDHAASKVNKTMSGGPFGLFDAIGNVGYAILKFGGIAQGGTDELTGMASAGGDAEKSMTGLSGVFSGLAPVLSLAVGGIAAFGAALLVLPALVAAVTFVAVALVEVITTLSAILVALLGPLSIVAVLLGGLAAAFVLAGKKALEGHGQFAAFADKVQALGGQFQSLVRTLAGRLLPYFWQLADAAQAALNYLNHIAKLPLRQAFHSLATEGVKLFTDFVYHVANVLKTPFRMAIEIAFGQGGANAQQALGDMWTSLTRYLFGYTKSHPVRLPTGAFVVEKKTVDGALQPFVDWFNRQHFVDTGIRWGRQIIDGVVRALGHDKGFRQAVRRIATDAGHIAGRAFGASFGWEIGKLKGQIRGHFMDILHNINFSQWLSDQITSRAPAAWAVVQHAAGRAWAAIKAQALHEWDAVVHAIENVIHINIDWPSPPGWLSALTGGLGGSGGSGGQGGTPSTGKGHVGATGAIVTMPTLALIGEAGPEMVVPLNRAPGARPLPHDAGGGGVPVVMNFYGFDDATIKTAAAKLKRHMDRQTARRA